jgi:hypothetical protein
MTTKIKRFKLKTYRLLGIKRCRTKKEPKTPPININDAIGKFETTYPLNWKECLSHVCQDGTIIKYNPIDNQQATLDALSKLKKDCIKGNSLD